jgi:hypothetical protein
LGLGKKHIPAEHIQQANLTATSLLVTQFMHENLTLTNYTPRENPRKTAIARDSQSAILLPIFTPVGGLSAGPVRQERRAPIPQSGWDKRPQFEQ